LFALRALWALGSGGAGMVAHARSTILSRLRVRAALAFLFPRLAVGIWHQTFGSGVRG